MLDTLTDKQEKFLELIFRPEYANNYKKAATDAGYAEGTHVVQIIKTLKDHIIDRIETELVAKSPETLARFFGMLSTPDMKGAKTILDATALILDRIGIVKKEKIELETKSASGIFILPSKVDVV